MSRIRGKNTKPELLVRKYLFSRGYRYRLHDKRYPGKPDIFIPRLKTAIFVHGCFWHGHGCRLSYIPKSRTAFWVEKIKANAQRDNQKQKQLEDGGLRVLAVWECELRKDPKATLSKLESQLG